MVGLESRAVPAITFPGIAGIAFDASGDVFVSYDSSGGVSGAQQSVAEVGASGYLTHPSLFSTTGSPGAMTTVGASASLPFVAAGEILELQPDGQLYAFDPATGTHAMVDDLANDTLSASSVYDVQTGASADLSGRIGLSGATFGDLGVYRDSLAVSAVSNGWDFVVRVTYGSSGTTATAMVASPIGAGQSASPGGVAVDSQGTVLTTMPYQGAAGAMHVPVGFGLSYDAGTGPAPTLPTLGLASVPDIDSGGIAVDAQDNFLLAVKDSSLYATDGGQGIVHINGALTAFLADPTSAASAIPSAIAYGSVGGADKLAFTDAASDTYTEAGELPLFSGQATPAQLRHAYGIDQIRLPGPGGTTVTGDGAGQTIAIVEEGVDPTLVADLKTFDQFFGIPDPRIQVVDQDGVTTQNLDIVGEAALDVEWAHAIAPGASIVVYNAAYDPNNATTSFENLMLAMQQASKLPGVSVVSLSYGLPEDAFASMGLSQSTFDSYFTTPGVTFVVAAGDSGIYGNGGSQATADYPAASPNVLAVGGTSVTIPADGSYPGTGPTGEVVWGSGRQSGSTGGGGGGLSAVESQPSWQAGVVPSGLDPYGARALPDVSIDSGAAQEYDVFTSTLSGSTVSASAVGWLGDAGTSAGAPIWAGLIAIADQGRALLGAAPLSGNTQTLPAIYSLPAADYHDIVYGNNGDAAGTGYDLASGRGTPVANVLVPDLVGYGIARTMTIQSGPPSSVAAGYTFSLAVRVKDGLGNPAIGGIATVALGDNPGGATLGGTLTEPVVDGVATFTDLTINLPDSGYTLTITDSALPGSSLTSGTITVTPGLAATRIVPSASPEAPVFGQAVTLGATVSLIGTGADVPTGTVTFKDGAIVLGTADLKDGVAQITTTALPTGSDTITIAYGGNSSDQAVSVNLTVAVARAAAALSFGDLNFTYDGSPHAAVVATNPGGLSGVAVTYTLGGVAVAAPTRSGTYIVTATLTNPDYAAAPITGTLVIGQATPTIAWSIPRDITAGTPLGGGQLDAVASFDGIPMAGTLTYTPSAGTVLPAGLGQVLTVTFAPADAVDFRPATFSVPINVLSPPSPTPTTPAPTPTTPAPTPVVIVGEQPIYSRRVRKNGKATGPMVLTGFRIDYNQPIGAAAVLDPANYELSSVSFKRARKHRIRILHPIRDFTVSDTPASDSVTIDLAGAEAFRQGGQLVVMPGVTGDQGLVLAGPTVFTITPRGKAIGPS